MMTKKVNPWAMVAILCAVGLCPIFTIASVLLGFRALVDINAKGDTRGRRLAWAAILIGGLTTGLWGGGMLWWNFNVRDRIDHGPVNAMLEGQNGNTTAFESVFVTPENNEATATFFTEVHDRYGTLLSGMMDPDIEESPVDGSKLFLGMVPLEAELSYVLEFENAKKVKLTGKFILFESVEKGGQFSNRFVWIRIHDEDRGDLVYPAVVTQEEHGNSGQ